MSDLTEEQLGEIGRQIVMVKEYPGDEHRAGELARGGATQLLSAYIELGAKMESQKKKNMELLELVAKLSAFVVKDQS